MQKINIRIKIPNYFSTFILILILIIGAFLRFYRIREYMVFLGDEGRDMLVVKRMIVDGKLTLLGPITSVGSMYMGPIYYYFMAPFLWLWRLDPVGPSVMVAIFSLATIYMIYRLTADFFYKEAGLLAAFFYAISPLTIIHGRSSWNPNIVPFFSVLLIYSLLKVIVRQKFNFLVLTGVCLGILIQLHYVTYLFFPIIFFSLLLIQFKIPPKIYFGFILGLILAYSPFLLFELRHQFVNTVAVVRFLLEQKESRPFSLISIWQIITDVLVRIFWRVLVIENAFLTKMFIYFSTISLFFGLKGEKKKDIKLSFKILLLWLTVGVSSFAFYRGITYDYYFGALFALPAIIASLTFYYLWRRHKFGRFLTLFLVMLIVFFNVKNSPLKMEPNNLLRNTEEIARFVLEKAGNKPYNFALIAGKNSDHAYRYFLEIWGRSPLTIENPEVDPERKTVADQLLVICEEKVCQPLGHPLWEIAGFGRAEIDGEWDVVTAKVFRLVHYQGKISYD